MQLSRDTVTGAALIVAGAAMFAGARGFMTPAAMNFGAGFFPKIVSCGMALSGLLILLGGLRARDGDKPLRPDLRGMARVATLTGLLVIYALILDPLGFHVATAALLLSAALFFGARPLPALTLAVVTTVILHFVFYSVMKVALPWGLLLPVAW
ncbi:MAG: tripartite tricarboxylate transporter TctB family protein [Tropicimonas sp.]|uniref:tripartite tricarboxylate transporter TctB family protein n=1 Tax=Tropicimonas sp. TaxID=2067044 RepID=UPI003A855411